MKFIQHANSVYRHWVFLLFKADSPLEFGVGALRKWQASRGYFLGPTLTASANLIGNGGGGRICERIVIFNKRDLVPEWGYEVQFHSALKCGDTNFNPDSHFAEQWQQGSHFNRYSLRRAINTRISRI